MEIDRRYYMSDGGRDGRGLEGGETSIGEISFYDLVRLLDFSLGEITEDRINHFARGYRYPVDFGGGYVSGIEEKYLRKGFQIDEITVEMDRKVQTFLEKDNDDFDYYRTVDFMGNFVSLIDLIDKRGEEDKTLEEVFDRKMIEWLVENPELKKLFFSVIECGEGEDLDSLDSLLHWMLNKSEKLGLSEGEVEYLDYAIQKGESWWFNYTEFGE